MKNTVLLLYLLTFTSLLNAQITITGTVKDDANIAIEYANVVLLDNTAKIIKGTITDEKGNFTLEAPQNDTYKLQISYIGFADYTKTISASVALGTIVMKTGNALDEIVLTSRKKIIERKVDRLVFNVQNAPFLKASDGVEILKRTPRINTNNDDISILGKDKVRVMINDRMTTLSGGELSAYLQTLTAKDILKIEVISNPSAKYSAAGNTGIINIVLTKKQADYYSGNIRAIYKPATYNAGEIMGSYNFKKGKWLFSAYLNKDKGKRANLMNSTIEYPNQKWVNNTVGEPKFNDIYGKMSLDYNLSSNTLIGIQYSTVSSKNPASSNSKTSIYNQNTLDSLIINKRTSNLDYYSHSINTHFQTKLDTLGKKLAIDLDYYKFNQNQEDFFESSSPSTYQSKNNNGVNGINNLSGKIDLDLPLGFAKLETGLKISTITNNSDIKNYDIINGVPIFNSNQSNEFEYTENNQAIYFSAKKAINKNWATKLGLRLESTQTKGYSKTLNETTKNDYLKLFPTFYLTYKANEANSFSFEYAKRIKKPNYFFLNPFKFNIDIYTYAEGNPLLKPSLIDNVEISHSYKTLLQTTLYYQYVENGFKQISVLHPNNIRQFIPKNFYNSTQIGFVESVSFNISKFWKTSNTIYLYYLKANATIPEVRAENKGFSANIGTKNTFILNIKKTFFATLNYWYQFPEASNLEDTDAYSRLDIRFRGLFYNKKFVMSIGVTDIFKTHNPTFTAFTSDNVKTTFDSYYDKRRLNFSLTYHFGNTKIKSKNHSGSNSEEKSRAN